MALTIVTSPQYDFSTSPAKFSCWYAANNPLIWTLNGAGSTGSPSVLDGIEVKIYNESSVVIYTGIYTAGVNDLFTIDLTTVIKELVILENTFEYDVINQKEDRLSHKFTVVFKSGPIVSGAIPEEGTGGSVTRDLQYAVHAARQLGCIYGSNLAEYATQPTGDPVAKFLNEFDIPKYWPGYPWAIDFIWNHGDYVTDIVEDLAPYGAHDYHAYELVKTDNIEHINHVMLHGGYSVNKIGIALSSDNGGAITVSESKIIEIATFEDINPFYIRWIGKLGGTYHWLFNINYIKSIPITDQIISMLNVTNLITDVGTHAVRSNRELPMISVGAEPLTANQWDVLSRQLGGTIYAQYYDTTLLKWFNCIVVPNTYERNTKLQPYKIEFKLILPEIFNQSL